MVNMKFAVEKGPHIQNKRSTFSMMVELGICLLGLFLFEMISYYVSFGGEWGNHALIIFVISVGVSVGSDALYLIPSCLCDKKEKEVKLNDNEVLLENIKYTLDKDEEGYGLKYKIASNFRKSEMINAINYYSENIEDRPYFVIRLLQYKDKDIEYAIKDSASSSDKKEEVKINDLDYTKVHFLNFSGADVNIYYHKHNNDTYAFVFTSGLDLSRLENIFLESINYGDQNEKEE